MTREIKPIKGGYIGYVKVGKINVYAAIDADYYKVHQKINVKYELLQRT